MKNDKKIPYFERHIGELKERRERIIKGLINSIPLKFERFRKWLPGVEKRKYVIITANQKVGKSKYADDLYVYDPFFYSLENPDKVRYKVLYFSLEMGVKEKYNEFLSHLIHRLDGIRISPTDLKSTDNDRPVPKYILDLLESERYQKYIKAFDECVTYVEHERNPTGINKFCRNFALTRGQLIMKKQTVVDNITGKNKTVTVPDYYKPDDPEEYVTVIIDNYSNLTIETKRGYGKLSNRENIEKMSKYAITLRDQLEFNVVAVQHQAQSQESNENQKYNKLKPTSDGLADAKTTIRDCNLALGLFSPYKHGIKNYEGYDITKFKNHIRFLEIIEDRDNGGSGQMCPLFFDGATSEFHELPLSDDEHALNRIYKYMETMYDPIPKELPESKRSVLMMIKSIKKEFKKLISR